MKADAPFALNSIAAGDDLFRRILHNEITLRTLHAVLIGIVVDDGMTVTKVVPGWWRRNGPLKRSSIPRIIGSDLALEVAVNQVEKENQLRAAGHQSRNGDEFMQR